MILCFFFFFFQAEDGIRDDLVTGVQTCALPILPMPRAVRRALPLVALLVVAGIVGGVVASSSEPDWTPFPPLAMGTRPDLVDASAFRTRWPIKHVVFIIKENRTFDQVFG